MKRTSLMKIFLVLMMLSTIGAIKSTDSIEEIHKCFLKNIPGCFPAYYWSEYGDDPEVFTPDFLDQIEAVYKKSDISPAHRKFLIFILAKWRGYSICAESCKYIDEASGNFNDYNGYLLTLVKNDCPCTVSKLNQAEKLFASHEAKADIAQYKLSMGLLKNDDDLKPYMTNLENCAGIVNGISESPYREFQRTLLTCLESPNPAARSNALYAYNEGGYPNAFEQNVRALDDGHTFVVVIAMHLLREQNERKIAKKVVMDHAYFLKSEDKDVVAGFILFMDSSELTKAEKKELLETYNINCGDFSCRTQAVCREIMEQ